MKCPFCDHLSDKVVDSRESKDGALIRRRRECQSCSRRFTSYERIEEVQFVVIKKDQSRQLFDREKLLTGILASCQKRPVSMAACQALVNEVQDRIAEHSSREIESRQIGELVMARLKELDKVAYIRFASVYREFKDLSDFMGEVKPLIEEKGRDSTEE